jgi:hypothetical protein
MKRRGQLAKVSLDSLAAATVSTVTALRESLGVPATGAQIALPPGTSARSIPGAAHLLQPTQEGFRAMAALLSSPGPAPTLAVFRDTMRGDPRGLYPPGAGLPCVLPVDVATAKVLFRAFSEFYSGLEKAYKTQVFEQVHGDRFEGDASDPAELTLSQRKHRAKQATLSHLLKFAGGENLWAPGQSIYSAAQQGYLLGTNAGPLIHDWLTVNNIPIPLEQVVLDGHAARLGAFMAAKPLCLGRAGFMDQHRSLITSTQHYDREVREQVHTVTTSPQARREIVEADEVGRTWAWAFKSHDPRKRPALEQYGLYDLVVSAWIWHALDEVDPYIGSSRVKSQTGPRGELVGTFPTGESLVRLSTKRAVMIEGKLRGLCLRHSGTAQNYMNRGEILSLRDPKGRVIFTMMVSAPGQTGWHYGQYQQAGGSGYRVSEVKGANNATLQDKRHKALLEQIKRGIGVDGIFNAPPAIRKILQKSARKEVPYSLRLRLTSTHGEPVNLDEIDQLLTSQGAPPFEPIPKTLPHMRVFSHPISPDIIASIDAASLTKDEQLQLYGALSKSSNSAISNMAEALKKQFPFDVAGSVGNSATMSHGLMVKGKFVQHVDYLGGSWTEEVTSVVPGEGIAGPAGPISSTREIHHPLPKPYRDLISPRTYASMKTHGDPITGVVTSKGDTLAQARTGTLKGLGITSAFLLRDKGGANLNKLMFLLSRKADEGKEDQDEAQSDVAMKSVRLMEVLPKKPVRWRGSTGTKITISPSSRWVTYDRGWGRGTTRYARDFYAKAPKLILHPRNITASQQISKTLLFELNVSSVELVMPLEYRRPRQTDSERERQDKKRTATELVISARGGIKITGARRGTFRHATLARLHARWIRWAQARLKTVRDLYWPELYTMPVGWSWRSRDQYLPLHRWLWEKGGAEKLIQDQEKKLETTRRQLRMSRWAAKGYGGKNQTPRGLLRQVNQASAMSSVYRIQVPPG